MKNVIRIILVFYSCMIMQKVEAQRIGISDVTHIPDSSAVLDVFSTSKGILIPRINDSTAIVKPVNGLFAYFTSTNSFWYYKSNKWCEFSAIINDSLKHGGANDYLAIGPDGFLYLNGEATAFDDLRTPVSSIDKKGVNDPDLISFLSNFVVLGFDKDKLEEVYFIVQLPHSYKEGSTIYPHLHWIQPTSGTGNVVWKLDYSWASANTVFPASTTLTSTGIVSGTANTHQITGFGGIDGTGQKISSMLVCRLYRDGANASDTYNADAGLLEIDFHFEINTLGSNQEYVK